MNEMEAIFATIEGLNDRLRDSKERLSFAMTRARIDRGALHERVPREAVDESLGKAQDFADLPHRGARAIANEVRHHGGVGAAVLPVDVLNGFFATVVLDVEIDVRRLRALARDETLEEKSHAHRIDGGDAEGEADRGVRRRAASLAEDALLLTETHDLPHGEFRPLRMGLQLGDADDDARLQPGGTVTGRIDVPPEWTWIDVALTDGILELTVRARKDGTFEIPGVPDGRFRMAVRVWGDRDGWPVLSMGASDVAAGMHVELPP